MAKKKKTKKKGKAKTAKASGSRIKARKGAADSNKSKKTGWSAGKGK